MNSQIIKGNITGVGPNCARHGSRIINMCFTT
jgi:hypothetical protein